MATELVHSLLLNLLVWLSKFQKQPRFGRWVRLEEQKNRILKAVEESSDEFPNHLFDFLSTALYFPNRFYCKAKWIDVIKAFYLLITQNSYKTELALFEQSKEKKKNDTMSWDYDGRSLHLYSHLLAKEYGWKLEYIYNLKLDFVLPLIQEILLDEQLEKEFQWTMSERSAYYDDKTKTSKMNPLPRPSWMNKHIDPKKELKITKIPTNLLPAGTGYSVADILKAQTS
jgi:hypothetical protein